MGFFNGTSVISTDNLTICEEKVVTMIESGNDTYINGIEYNYNRSNLTLLFDTVDAGLYTTYQAYDISYSCYYGAIEGASAAGTFGNWLNDPQIIMWNVVYNVGLVYDSVKDIITFFIGDERGNADSWFLAGFNIG